MNTQQLAAIKELTHFGVLPYQFDEELALTLYCQLWHFTKGNCPSTFDEWFASADMEQLTTTVCEYMESNAPLSDIEKACIELQALLPDLRSAFDKYTGSALSETCDFFNDSSDSDDILTMLFEQATFEELKHAYTYRF